MNAAEKIKPPITSLMLVDDNEFDQMMYKRIVDRSGLVENLLQFINPQEALDHLFDASLEMPSLVLLDINMPKIDGFEFLESVTSELGERMCPVIIMLTTSLDPRDEERARRHKIVRDFHNKPMTLALLEHLASLELS
ncbi:MAG: response regulator [Paracoccaceae bacterium]